MCPILAHNKIKTYNFCNTAKTLSKVQIPIKERFNIVFHAITTQRDRRCHSDESEYDVSMIVQV